MRNKYHSPTFFETLGLQNIKSYLINTKWKFSLDFAISDISSQNLVQYKEGYEAGWGNELSGYRRPTSDNVDQKEEKATEMGGPQEVVTNTQ